MKSSLSDGGHPPGLAAIASRTNHPESSSHAELQVYVFNWRAEISRRGALAEAMRVVSCVSAHPGSGLFLIGKTSRFEQGPERSCLLGRRNVRRGVWRLKRHCVCRFAGPALGQGCVPASSGAAAMLSERCGNVYTTSRTPNHLEKTSHQTVKRHHGAS